MEHPKAIGDRSTLAIMTALSEIGFDLFVPFGENTRSDLVIDDGRRLFRVQCKTGRLRDGAVRFRTCSSYAHHPNARLAYRDYQGQVEYLAVYCPETGGVYLLPIDEIPLKRQGSLRVDASKNGQERRIRFAARYEIGRVQSYRNGENWRFVCKNDADDS